MPDSQPSKKRRFPILKTLLALLLLASVVVGSLGYLLLSTPEHIRKAEAFIEQTPVAQLDDIAENLEQRLTNVWGNTNSSMDARTRALLTGINTRGSHSTQLASNTPPPTDNNQPQTVKMSYDEVNAWFSRRFKDWVRNQGGSLPSFARNYLLTYKDGSLVLGCHMTTRQVSGWVSFYTDINVSPDGQAIITVTQIDAGRLNLPRERISSQIKEYADSSKSEKVREFAGAFDGKAFNPVFPLDSKADARITGFKADADGLTLELIRLPR